ncbi:hypothetical protein DFJ73DRAFT_842267 [Zopfochytrium polystomum]|nr:hypothetical protein DFJ73DRAFT_842267 [Zopfochytrium polystomum]
MVPSNWWKTMFDSLYLRTDGDVVEDPQVTREEIGMLERDPAIKTVFLKGADKNQAGGKILDLCCGQGRHSLYLAKQYPHLELFGHDQSAYLIKIAQERARDLRRNQPLHRPPVFTVGDCREIPFPSSTFDLVMVMGNSFGYFADEDDDRAVLDEIHRVLTPGGVAVLDVTDGAYLRRHFEQRSWEWLDDGVFVCREREMSEDGLRLSSREVITSTTRGVLRDQFYRERLYSEQEIGQLVHNAGFEVLARPEAATDRTRTAASLTFAHDLSKRQEDLGMMGHRMIVVFRKTGPNPARQAELARVQTESPASDSSLTLEAATDSGKNDTQLKAMNRMSVAIPNVPKSNVAPVFDDLLLIMGDPAQPCFGKLNNTWNDEDILTRQKLVDALSEIGYWAKNLTLIERHETMYESLQSLIRTNPNRVVLNLCDEGFDNDALKELHVPAVLEILRIPYTGAGPNCLAHCYDKGLVNSTAKAIGVPTPKEVFHLGSRDTAHPAAAAAAAAAAVSGSDFREKSVSSVDKLFAAIRDEVGFPAFVKPIRGDNSLGITSYSIIRSESDLRHCLDSLRDLGIQDITAQEYLEGTEYGVGMIGNPERGFHFLPTLRVDFSKIVSKGLAPILGFESKWDPTSPYWSEVSYHRANLPPQIERQLRDHCVTLWERFGCRDYARFDWRCDRGDGDGRDGLGGTIKLLEVNPNPGWCWDGKLAYMAKMEGLEYRDVLKLILEAAKERIEAEALSPN